MWTGSKQAVRGRGAPCTGPLRYTASLLMPLSALLSVAGALYGHQVISYLAEVLHLAQARMSKALLLCAGGPATLQYTAAKDSLSGVNLSCIA